MERDQPAHDEQQQQGHEQTGNHTAEVDPHIPHGRSAARHIQLDGFIQQRGRHAAQHGPADMAHKTAGINPQAEHKQEAFQREL